MVNVIKNVLGFLGNLFVPTGSKRKRFSSESKRKKRSHKRKKARISSTYENASKPKWLDILNKDGKIIAYIQVPDLDEEVDMKKILNVTALISQDSELTNTSSTWVRVLDMEGSVIAMVQSPQASGDPRDVNKTNKPEILNNVHLKQKKEENINAPLVNATQKMISGPVFDPAMWNGYPNVVKQKDGTKRDPEASKWKDGAIYDHKCLGVINCDRQPACRVAYHPKTRSESLQLQLQQSCVCGGKLILKDCGVISTMYKWAGGAHFYNKGIHNHDIPSRVVTPLKQQKDKFVNTVHKFPHAGPSELLTGPRAPDGVPGESVAEISPAYANLDRVAKE
ncbi:hypothetical protein BDQ17DRAFT_1420423 [Cyathus striatus]|nr:hypothetical protein BDQ17DRAFT_1420423 [Cyathus striatus]